MQKSCSSDPMNPMSDCICPENTVLTSTVNTDGVIGNYCLSPVDLTPPHCDTSVGAPCICPMELKDNKGNMVSKTVTKGPGMNGKDIYYCKSKIESFTSKPICSTNSILATFKDCDCPKKSGIASNKKTIMADYGNDKPMMGFFCQ
jgi:hypothetical protein